MRERPRWQYDEMKHCGVDYSDPGQVEVYDARHQRFRDHEEEARAILDALDIGPDDTIIDLGCGSGAFALPAARFCKKVYAVDVSEAMLEYCRQKAREGVLSNIEFRQGGFLTYEHDGEATNVIVSVAVLHHLPDFWKLVG